MSDKQGMILEFHCLAAVGYTREPPTNEVCVRNSGRSETLTLLSPNVTRAVYPDGEVFTL